MADDDKQECSKFEHVPLEQAEATWKKYYDADHSQQEFYRMMGNMVSLLSEDDKRRFMHGKRGLFRMGLTGCESRSGGYELMAAFKVGIILLDLDLVTENSKGFRDAKTNKRITTRLRELARLSWLQEDTEETRAWLQENWEAATNWPLDELKQWIREHNSNAKG